MRRDLIVDLMFIAGKCGAFKNVTMASHSSLSETLILQLNATIIGFMGRSKEEYTGIIYSSPGVRARLASEGQPCSVHIRLPGKCSSF